MDSKELSTGKALGLLIVGAICISFSPVFVKAIGEHALGPTPIAFWRTFLGAIILFAWAKIAGQPLLIPIRMIGWATLAGAIFTADLFMWHRSINYCGAGMSTILGNTQVFNTAILSWFIFREKPGSKFVVAAILAIMGVAMLAGVGSDVQFTDIYVRGLIFGLGTGVAYACYIVTIRHTTKKADRPPLLSFVAWVSLMTSVVALIICGFESTPFMPSGLNSWMNLLGLGLVVQAVGWYAISTALSKVEGARAGLTLLLQPTLAMVWGWMLFAEHLNLFQIIGACITLLAIYIGSIKHKTNQ